MSHLSQTAEYALRAMTQLALVKDDAITSSRDLAAQANVPSFYLSKIMRKLVSAKLIIASKGPGGGFRLARPRASIRFLDIIAAVGEQPKPDHCAFGWGRCDTAKPCPIHPAFSKLNDQMWTWATETTLADVKPALARGRRAR